MSTEGEHHEDEEDVAAQLMRTRTELAEAQQNLDKVSRVATEALRLMTDEQLSKLRRVVGDLDTGTGS